MKALFLIAFLLVASPAFGGDYVITLTPAEEATLASEAAEQGKSKQEVMDAMLAFVHDVLSSQTVEHNRKAIENMSPAAKAAAGLR